MTWRSKKQSVVARSSAEAKFRSMAHGVCEALWLKMLTEVGFLIQGPITLFYDNKAAINNTHDLVQHDKTKHVEVDQHFIKDHINKESICIPYIQTEAQLVHIITKVLSGAPFTSLVGKLRMCNIYSPAGGEVLEYME